MKWIFTVSFLLGLGVWLIAASGKCNDAFRDRIIAAHKSLHKPEIEVVASEDLADAILSIKGVNGEWAALLIAVADSESATLERIRLGGCRPHECDAYKDKSGEIQHKAWGLWQSHKNKLNEDVWGSTDLKVQTTSASKMLRSAFYSCLHSKVPFPLGAIRAYAGRGCSQPFPGEEKRIATFNRLRRIL